MNTFIKKMSLDDLEQIKNNLNNFDDFWTYSILKQELLNKNSKYIVCKSENEIIGFAGIWISPVDIHITNIVIRKDLRNNKFGTILLQELLDLAKNENKKEITLEVNKNNTAAIKLYSKFEFKEIGIRKKYYNNIDDAIIMTKKI